MRIVFYAITAVFALMIGLAVGVLAENDTEPQFQPFAVDISHAAPVEVTLSEGVTVPMTVSVDLRVRVDGPEEATVEIIGAHEPVIAAAELPAEQASDAPWVTVGGTRWRVLPEPYSHNTGSFMKAREGSGRPDATTRHKFVWVSFEIENLSAEIGHFDPPKLVDGIGRHYATYEYDVWYIENSCYAKPLNPNLTRSCAVIFEVPRDAEGFSVIIHDQHEYGQDRVTESVLLGF